MKKNFVSIILPTLNERENIVPLIIEIKKRVRGKKEIIVVDDNSPDGTAKEVKKLIKSGRASGVRIIVRKKNHGLTASLWEGIKESRGEVVIWMDCDFSHPPHIIPKLLERIDGGYDIAVASRFIKGGGFKENFQDGSDSLLQTILSRIMNYTIQIFLDNRFKDYTSGFIAVRRNVFEDVNLRGDYGEYFIDFMTRAILLGYKFVEIPFINLPRKYGKSKTGSTLGVLLTRGLKYITLSISLFVLRITHILGFGGSVKSQTEKFR